MPLGFPQGDEGRMDRPFDGRLPTELYVAAGRTPEAHASGWNDDEAEPPVVDLDDVDPFAPPAAEGPLGYAISTGRAADVFWTERVRRSW